MMDWTDEVRNLHGDRHLVPARTLRSLYVASIYISTRYCANSRLRPFLWSESPHGAGRQQSAWGRPEAVEVFGVGDPETGTTLNGARQEGALGLDSQHGAVGVYEVKSIQTSTAQTPGPRNSDPTHAGRGKIRVDRVPPR